MDGGGYFLETKLRLDMVFEGVFGAGTLGFINCPQFGQNGLICLLPISLVFGGESGRLAVATCDDRGNILTPFAEDFFAFEVGD